MVYYFLTKTLKKILWKNECEKYRNQGCWKSGHSMATNMVQPIRFQRRRCSFKKFIHVPILSACEIVTLLSPWNTSNIIQTIWAYRCLKSYESILLTLLYQSLFLWNITDNSIKFLSYKSATSERWNAPRLSNTLVLHEDMHMFVDFSFPTSIEMQHKITETI